MSLEKAIAHNKEHRKQYRGDKLIDPRCRNHGDDYISKENRTFSQLKNSDKNTKWKVYN